MELERKYTKLQQMNNDLNLTKSQLVTLQNKTNQINIDVFIIKQLGNIKPLQEIQALQQAVQTVSAQTYSLSANERTRSQEFLALYNMTIDSKQELSEITMNTSNHLKEFETKTSYLLFNLEHRQNTTAIDINNQLKELETKTNTQLLRIEQIKNSTVADIITRIDAKETSDNLTMTTVQKQINNNAERVAMTAHPLSSGSVTRTIMKFSDVQYSVVSMTANPTSAGTTRDTIMKFDDVKFSMGITNLGAYKNTGRFTCEHEGLYLISASVLSYISGASYKINGNFI
ncbi:Hypothetical predicted protein [Mytilus galloprovincialis]|uniref:C1q domain-containing protein n=1 Tax=Mytilus galloprovincialis TaxID=29158 RepID=A0A8B6CX59_MYTGA|nr:Hypothetical predicted protein [Mytilus galloprovincialis]